MTIVKPTAEDRSVVLTASGVVADGPVEISAITLSAGSDAAKVTIDDSEDGNGTDKWVLSALTNDTVSITFPKPIPFSIGCYATITGTGPSVSVALTNS